MNLTAANIRNMYLRAPSSKKHYIICGTEFGLDNVEKRLPSSNVPLYGGKVSGRDFYLQLRSCMDILGFTSCVADPDV
ncbi:hypothetical protein ACHAWF_000023, partial [Thalassiosira exigua]